MQWGRVVVTTAALLFAAACASGTDTASTTDPSAAPTTSPATATRPAASTPPPAAFTTTTDLVYMTVDDVELRMDVYTPDGPGPWPVAVVFHGRSDQGKDAASTTTVAAAAAAGMVVFAPTWYAGDPFPIGIDDLESLTDAGNCAVAYAQQHAADHGGDAARTAVHGFSAGTGPALASVLDPSDVAIDGCNARPATEPVAGAVLGDGEYFWQSEAFDHAFRDDLDAMRAKVAAFTDPAAWPDDLDATFVLWAAADGTAPRQIGDPNDETGWLAQRDQSGSIRSDLDRLGQLADGIVSYIDSAQLLELRLAEDGHDVTLTIAPGGHTIDDKVPELVEWLTAAAG